MKNFACIETLGYTKTRVSLSQAWLNYADDFGPSKVHSPIKWFFGGDTPFISFSNPLLKCKASSIEVVKAASEAGRASIPIQSMSN